MSPTMTMRHMSISPVDRHGVTAVSLDESKRRYLLARHLLATTQAIGPTRSQTGKTDSYAE
jgi:hypothetical protein